MTPIEQTIIDATTDYYGMEIPWTRDPRSGLWQISVEDITVRIANDDGTVHVMVFTGGMAMLLSSKAEFWNMPAPVVAAAIGHHLDAALAAA